MVAWKKKIRIKQERVKEGRKGEGGVQLHDDVVVLVGFEHLREAHDVGVLARRENVDFGLKHLKALGASILLGDDLGSPFLAGSLLDRQFDHRVVTAAHGEAND
jgi:hypothetical protein